MENIPAEKEELIKEIKAMKQGSIEQMALVTYYSLASYFKSLLTFGRKSTVTKDNLNVIKEMYNILKKENQLLNFILRNVLQFDVDATAKVVEMLDSLNDKTVQYYYEVIEEIETACECNEERRGLRPRKDFSTIVQSDTYATEVIALAENLDSLKVFLDYEPEFWIFIKPYIKTARANLETMSGMFYAIPIIDENDKVCGISLLVPEIVDLKSALLCIKLYEEAYRIYKFRGKVYQKDSSGSVDLSKQYEEEFLQSKLQMTFKNKIKINN